MEENKTKAPVSAPAANASAKPAESAHAPAANGTHGYRPAGHGSRPGFGAGNGKGRPGQRNFRGRRDRDLMDFDEKVVKINRVSKTVKGGKRVRFTALVVIGDGKGKYGFGLGKSAEVPEAIKKALSVAKRNMFHLEIVKGGTIAHPVMGKFGATQVFLKPAPEGTGLVAGGAVRAILELAGVKNVYSKIYGSRTQTNAVKATVDGLGKLKSFKQVELVRFGKKVEDEKPAAKPATTEAK
jgi:small subunit ribosomal protein S5